VDCACPLTLSVRLLAELVRGRYRSKQARKLRRTTGTPHGNPDQRLLAYQYMQMLPQIAQGNANKVWIVPSEIGKALEGIGGFFSNAAAARTQEANGPAGSGPGPQLNAPAGRHASFEGWLAGSGGPVHDGAVADHEGGSVPGAGDAGSAPLHHDPALMEGSSEMGAAV
jgi:hypothetical protein